MKIYTENFTIILNKHITNTEIDTYEFRVLCYLLMLADDGGICFPSYNTIAEKIGIGETKAKNAIKHLIELGIIKKTTAQKKTAVPAPIYMWYVKRPLCRSQKNLMKLFQVRPLACLTTYPMIVERLRVVCKTTTINTQIQIINILLITIYHQ